MAACRIEVLLTKIETAGDLRTYLSRAIIPNPNHGTPSPTNKKLRNAPVFPTPLIFSNTPHCNVKAEEEREVIIQQAGEEARYRQCLARTRCECLAALENFLPALRKRLFLSVDVIGPVSNKRQRIHKMKGHVHGFTLSTRITS